MTGLRNLGQRLRQWLRVQLWLDPPPPRFDPDEAALLDALGDDWMVFEVLSLCRGLKSRQERQRVFEAVRAELRRRAVSENEGHGGEAGQ